MASKSTSFMMGTCVQRWNASLPRLTSLLQSHSYSRPFSASSVVGTSSYQSYRSSSIAYPNKQLGLPCYSVRTVSSLLVKTHNLNRRIPVSIAGTKTPPTRWISDDKPYSNDSDDELDSILSSSLSSTTSESTIPPPPQSNSSFLSSAPPLARNPSRNQNIGTFHAGAIMTGTVKFYLREKGYGFIIADGRPDTDLFVHRGSIICTHTLSETVLNATVRYPYLKQNERVRFVVSSDMGTVKAVNVTWLNGDAIPPERTNYLGGVHERSHRLFGEACMNILQQKADIRVPFSDEEYEKIRIAYIESKRAIEHAERILIELGMDLSTFPTIKGNSSGRGRYLFKSEVDDENKKSIEKAIAAAHNVQPSSNLSIASLVANNTSNPTTEDDFNNMMDQIDNDMYADTTPTSSLFDKEPPSESADVDDDIYSDNTPYKRR